MEKIQRHERIEIRLTLEEKNKLISMVDNSIDFNTIAKLFRFRMFEEEFYLPKTELVQVDPEYTRQVAKIGNNINQLTHHVNACAKGGEKYSAYELGELLKNIDLKITQLIKLHVK